MFVIVYLLLLMLCALMFLICIVGTGDEKNIISFDSYPDEVQEIVKNMPEYKDKIRKQNRSASFFMNLLIYSVLIFLFGLAIKSTSFLKNFINLSIIGQGFNLFDLLVIDFLWWRHTKRVRFKGTENNSELYKNPQKHIKAFFKGIILFLIIAIIDGFLLTLI